MEIKLIEQRQVTVFLGQHAMLCKFMRAVRRTKRYRLLAVPDAGRFARQGWALFFR